MKQVARRAGIGEELCLLALGFTLAPNDIRLRALVEDWDLDKIARGIAEAAQRTLLSTGRVGDELKRAGA